MENWTVGLALEGDFSCDPGDAAVGTQSSGINVRLPVREITGSMSG